MWHFFMAHSVETNRQTDRERHQGQGVSFVELCPVMLTRTWDSRPRPRTRDINVKFFNGLHRTLYIIFSLLMLCECFYVRVLFHVLTTFCQFMNKWICYRLRPIPGFTDTSDTRYFFPAPIPIRVPIPIPVVI